MTKSRYDVVVAAGRTMLHVPFALGGIAVFHSIPSAMLGGSELDLDACLLAKIFSGQITDWSDSEIRANNPGLTASGKIKVVRRKNGSSSTTGFTEYLNKKCPASWAVSNGCGSTGCATGSTIIWPTDFAIAEGSSGMSAYLQANDFAIGYIDAGHGHDAGLSEVALLNRDGKYLTTRQADIGAAAVQALAPPSVLPENATADFSAVNLYDLPGVDTWPSARTWRPREGAGGRGRALSRCTPLFGRALPAPAAAWTGLSACAHMLPRRLPARAYASSAQSR